MEATITFNNMKATITFNNMEATITFNKTNLKTVKKAEHLDITLGDDDYELAKRIHEFYSIVNKTLVQFGYVHAITKYKYLRPSACVYMGLSYGIIVHQE